MIGIRRLDTSKPDFDARLAELLAFESAQDTEVDATVATIIADVKARGDAALLDHTRRLDGIEARSMDDLTIRKQELWNAARGIPEATREALRSAASRIQTYHSKQLAASWEFTENDGTVLGQRVTPLERVGIYVPGGKDRPISFEQPPDGQYVLTLQRQR